MTVDSPRKLIFSDLLTGVGLVFSVKATGAALLFLFNLLLARKLGAEGAGLYFLALTAVTVTSVFGRLGLDNSLVRYIAVESARGNSAGVNGVYRQSMLIVFGLSALLALAMYSSSGFLAETLFGKPKLVVPLQLMSLAVLPLSVLTLQANSLKGLRRAGAAELMLSVSVPLVSLIGFLALVASLEARAALVAYVFSVSVSALGAIAVWRQCFPDWSAADGTFALSRLLSSGLPLYGFTILRLIRTWSPTLFLGVWAAVTEVGMYSAAARTAMLTSFLLLAVNSVVAPRFASLYADNRISELRTLLIQSWTITATLALPVFAVFILAPEWVMGLFGPEFRKAHDLLLVISIGQFINLVTGSVGYVVMMTGHERWMQRDAVFSSVLTVVLCLVCIPRFGAIGAAWATAVGVAVENLIALVLAWVILQRADHTPVTMPTMRDN